MTFSIRRKNVEGAKSLGIIPKAAHPLVDRILEAAPDVEVVDIAIRAYTKDSKEIDIGAALKMKIMSIILSNVGDKKE